MNFFTREHIIIYMNIIFMMKNMDLESQIISTNINNFTDPLELKNKETQEYAPVMLSSSIWGFATNLYNNLMKSF